MAAQALGAEIHGHERVWWRPLEGGVRVRTDRGVYEADKLVITAGAWDGELLDVLEGLAVPERQVLAWLQPTRPEYFQYFPVFNLLVDEGRFYGFPVHGVPGFKFGKYHHLEEKVDPRQSTARRTTTTSGSCGTSRSVTSPTAAARRWTSRPACSPTLRTTTSS